MIIAPLAVCMPIQKMWQVLPDPGREYICSFIPSSHTIQSCAANINLAICYPESAPEILYTVLACNIVTDLYLLWLPLPMLFRASLPKGTKITLGCLFGCGLFVTVAATLRITLLATVRHFSLHISAFDHSADKILVKPTRQPTVSRPSASGPTARPSSPSSPPTSPPFSCSCDGGFTRWFPRPRPKNTRPVARTPKDQSEGTSP